MTEAPSPRKSAGVLTWIKRHKIISGVIALVVVAIIAGAASGGGGDKAKPTATDPAPSTTPSSSTTPSPSAPADPAAELSAAVSDALGKSNRDGVHRVKSAVYNADTKRVVVMWAINDNLTNGLVKASARQDIVDLLKVVQKFEQSHPVKSATFAGTFSMQDQLGNASEDKVVEVEYPGSTVAKINFDHFLSDNVYKVSDDPFIAPAFQ